MYIQLWIIVCSIIFSRKLWKYHSQSKLRFDFDFLNFVQPYLSFNFEIFFKSNHLELLLPVWTLNIFKIFWISLPGILHFELWNIFLVFINWSELRNIFEIFSLKVNLIWTLKIFWNFLKLSLFELDFENFLKCFQLEVWLLNFENFLNWTCIYDWTLDTHVELLNCYWMMWLC